MPPLDTLGDYIRDQRTHAKVSLRQLAALAGVSNPYLSQIERGLRKPSAEILQQIAKGLRISAETLYVRAGILEERNGAQEVAAAIMSDPGLTPRQRRVLLDILDAFRRENATGEVPAEAVAAAAASSEPRRSAVRKIAAHKTAAPKTAVRKTAVRKTAVRKSAEPRAATPRKRSTPTPTAKPSSEEQT